MNSLIKKIKKKWDEGKEDFWLNCPSALQLTFAVSSPVSSTESPVYVVLADVIQVFVVGAVEELLFCDWAPAVLVLHLHFLPFFRKKE